MQSPKSKLLIIQDVSKKHYQDFIKLLISYLLTQTSQTKNNGNVKKRIQRGVDQRFL